MILWCFIVEKKHRRVHPQKKIPKFKTRANWGRNCWVLGWPFRSTENVSQVDISEVEDLEMMKRKKRWRPDPVVRVASGCPPGQLVGGSWHHPERWTDWHWRLFFFEDEFGLFKMHELIDDFEEMSQHLRSTCMRNHQIMMKHDDETWWWNIVMDHDLKITPLMAMFCDFQSGLLGRHSETQ